MGILAWIILGLLVLRQPFFGLNNHLLWTALTGAIEARRGALR